MHSRLSDVNICNVIGKRQRKRDIGREADKTTERQRERQADSRGTNRDR